MLIRRRRRGGARRAPGCRSWHRSSRVREVAQRGDAGQEEIGTAFQRREGGKPGEHFFSDRAAGGNGEFQRAVLDSADRVVLVVEFVEGLVVDPDVLCELELPDQAGTDDECRYTPPVDAIVRRAVGGVRGP